MSTSVSPQRPLYAWLAAGAVAALIALSMFVSIALAATHAAAPRPASAMTPSAVVPMAAEVALTILPRPRARAAASERCGHVRLGFGLRCLAGDLL